MIKTLVISFLLFALLMTGLAYIITEETKTFIANNVTNETLISPTSIAPKISIDLGDRAPSLEFVSATEYTKGDGTGSTIVKLIDWRGDKINTTCWEKILYPNKTTLIEWTDMTQHWEYGNYYMDFAVPEELGIYDQEVRCYVSNKNISIGKGFHVSNISNVVTENIDDLKVDNMQVWS